MNLILIRAGYPLVSVRPEDRLGYIRSLQQAQAGQGSGSFDWLLYQLTATGRPIVTAVLTADRSSLSQLNKIAA